MAVDGTYEVVVRTLKGPEPGKWVFKVDGTILKGTSERAGEVAEFTDGSVEGNEFQFRVKVKTPIGRINVPFKGVVEGDKILGTANTPFGAAPFEGNRVEGP